MGELDDLLDLGSTAGEAVEDGMDIGTGLHGDDAELILFVDPDEEGLFLVVEDTTTVGPVTVEAASLEEAVTLPIKSGYYLFQSYLNRNPTASSKNDATKGVS